MKAAAAAWACTTLLLLAGGGGGRVVAQQITPFQGRNKPPDGGVDVYVSPIIEYLISVDDADYKFQAVLYMLLTWTDPRAAVAVDTSTQAALSNSSYNNGAGCAYPCTTIYTWNRNPDAINQCCDYIWLPHFEFINVVGFSQDRVVRYGVQLGDNNSVAWWQHIQGEFYTPMSFRAFPFDTQYLSIQIQYGNKYPESPVNIIPSATGMQLYSPANGDELSGWTVEGVTMRTFNLSEQNLVKSGSSYSAPGDPWPINPTNPNEEAFQGFLWQNGLEVFIQVSRISLYYCITAILPIWLNTCLSLLVFSVNPRHLDTCLGIVVTLFLSLTALQFVLAAGLPSSATVVPTQQLIIVAYCILGGIGLCSILTFWMVQLQRTNERKRRLKQAKRQFTRRWVSVTQSMGLAAAAVTAMQQRAVDDRSGNGSTADLRWRKPSSKQQQRVSGREVGFAAGMAGAAPARGTGASEQPAAAQAAMPTSPFESQQQQQQDKQSGRPALVTDVSIAPRGGGMGVYVAASSESSGGGADSDNAVSVNSFASQSPCHSGMRVPEAPAPVAAADEEGGGSKQPLPSWLTQLDCCARRGRRRGNDAATAGGPPHQLNWLKLQWFKLKLMKEEMQRNQDYAMYVALRIDHCIFWTTLVGFNISVILIFAIQSQYDAVPDIA